MILLCVRQFDLTGKPQPREGAFERSWFRLSNEETNQTLDYNLIKNIPVPEEYKEFPEAEDEESPAPGSGATKLAAKAGVDVPENNVYPHPDMCTIRHENHAQCLKLIQKAMADPEQEPNVRMLYETVGVYLGYALAQYSEFYKIDHVMILGRVSKGKGGDLMLDTAKKVLATEFPQYAKIQFHTADDHFKAVGQCIAAAALPTFPKK